MNRVSTASSPHVAATACAAPLRRAPVQPSAAWLPCREASLNWLAFGVLLAAWNAADGDDAAGYRPAALRHHAQVSVRAALRAWNPGRLPST